MTERDIVVIGTSAGGVETLSRLFALIPGDLPAAVFVVMHISPESESMLAPIISRNSSLVAEPATDYGRFERGHIYVGVQDRHLIFEGGLMRLIRGPKENRHRPAVDPLFRSAAAEFGQRVIGIVLTGVLDDGAAGLSAIKTMGGLAIAQNPDEATYPGMPENAIARVNVDYILKITEIASMLPELVTRSVDSAVTAVPPDLQKELKVTAMDPALTSDSSRPGTPSAFSCPDCHGVLRQIDDDSGFRYRCTVGHAYSPESMASAQADAVEDALWIALQTLEESAAFSGRLATRERELGHHSLAERFEIRRRQSVERAESIRRILLHDEASSRGGLRISAE